MTDEQICLECGGVWHTRMGDDLYVIVPLMYHVALMKNPLPFGGCEHRWCYKSGPLAKQALEEFKESGKLRYWHKDWTNNKSVKDGLLYEAGMYQHPDYAVGEVDW